MGISNYLLFIDSINNIISEFNIDGYFTKSQI